MVAGKGFASSSLKKKRLVSWSFQETFFGVLPKNANCSPRTRGDRPRITPWHFWFFSWKRTPLHRLTKRTETKQKTQGVSGWGLFVCCGGKLVVWVGFGVNLPTIRQVSCRYVGLVRGDRPPYGFRRNQGGLFTSCGGAVPRTALYPTRMYMTDLGFGLCFLLS